MMLAWQTDRNNSTFFLQLLVTFIYVLLLSFVSAIHRPSRNKNKGEEEIRNQKTSSMRVQIRCGADFE